MISSQESRSIGSLPLAHPSYHCNFLVGKETVKAVVGTFQISLVPQPQLKLVNKFGNLNNINYCTYYFH